MYKSVAVFFRWLNLVIRCVPVLLAGCATVGMDESYRGAQERKVEDMALFQYSHQWEELSNDTYDGGRKRVEITWPGREEKQHPPLVLDYYPCKSGGYQPGLLISPIMGGSNKIAKHFAVYLSKRGYHCMVVHRPPNFFEGIEYPKVIDSLLRMAVIRDRMALDWLCQREEVDSSRLGSFGVSYGGIKNVILAGVEPRLKVNIFALAGGDLASLFMQSNLEELEAFRQRLIEKEGIDLKSFERDMRKLIKAEPLKFAPYIDARRTLLILARMDHTVPRRNGELLREALGYPRTVYIPAGHYSTALYTGMVYNPYLDTLVHQFFDEHLKR